MILETDSPYLTPVPFRGKRNDPSKLPLIAEKIASIKNCSVKEIAEVCTRNTLKLFGQWE
jgi:TatD DNase family protein